MNRAEMSPLTVLSTENSAALSSLTSTVLSADEVATLAAAVDRIIPPEAQSPGGAEGGALTYIVRHLEDGGNLASFRDDYHTFLHALGDADFTARDSAAQDALFSEMARTTATERFFRLFAEHAQEGYYTNPENWPGIGFIVTG